MENQTQSKEKTAASDSFHDFAAGIGKTVIILGLIFVGVSLAEKIAKSKKKAAAKKREEEEAKAEKEEEIADLKRKLSAKD